MAFDRQIDECSHLQLYATDSYFLGGKATYRWPVFWGQEFQPKIFHESFGENDGGKQGFILTVDVFIG